MKARACSFDTETTGLKPQRGARLYAISACDEAGKEYFWQWDVDPYTRSPKYQKNDPQLKDFQSVWYRYPIRVFHHAKFDLRHLNACGALPYKLEYIPTIWNSIEDTLLQSHVLDSNESHELKDLGIKYLDLLDDDEKQLAKQCKAVHKQVDQTWNLNYRETASGRTWIYQTDYWVLRALNPKDKTLEVYARRDAERTIRLWLFFRELLREEGLTEHYKRELKLLPVVYGMESQGLPVHKPTLHKELTRFTKARDYNYARLSTQAATKGLKDFNPASPKQLSTMLYNKLGFPVIRETKGSTEDKPTYSTDAATLQELKDHHCRSASKQTFLTTLLNYRSADTAVKYISNYRDLSVKVCNDARKNDFYYGILYATLNQTGTDTTRFSGQDPNPQNISAKEEMNLRAIFGPLPGFFWLDYDYSNIELRIFAHLSNEQSLIRAFETGDSVHRIICEGLHGPEMFKGNKDWKHDPRYKRTKNGNFAIIYGAGESRADSTYGVDGAYRKIRRLFPGLAKLSESTMEQVRQRGYVKTLFGYRLQCPKDRAYAALNYLIQGTAGDVMKNGMIQVAERMNPNQARMVLTVHDELIFSIPNTYKAPNVLKPIADELAACMEAPGEQIGIPCPVSRSITTTNWSECKELVLA